MRSTALADSETDESETVEEDVEDALPAVTLTAFPRTEAGADVEGAVEEEEATVDDVDNDECEDDVDDVDGLDFCIAEAADRVTLSERFGQDGSLA